VTNMSSATPAVSKSLFLDVRAALNALGISDTQIPSKIEGMAFGKDLADGRHTLWIANDNDFDPANAGDNKFYVFAVDANDLLSYQGQQIAVAAVPEPETFTMLLAGLAMLGAAVRRKKHKAA
jgi:hypothetical protein